MKRILAIALLGLAAIVAGCTREQEAQDSRGVAQDTQTTEIAKDFGVYHALIIGINNYQRWPRLQFAERDAKDIADLLISRYGFSPQRVTQLSGTQATRQAVLSTLRKKLQDLSDKDNLLIYYAGHGQLDPLTEKGYWVPVDGDLFDESSWIPFTQVTDYLSAPNVKAKNIVVLTDSCYGGALARSGPTPGHPTPDDANTERYVAELAKRAAKRSRQVLASGGFEQVPDESMFATLLKRALEENKFPAIDVELLFFTGIFPQIRIVGQQEPRIARVISGPDVDGQFVLLRSDSAVQKPGDPENPTTGDPVVVDTTNPQNGETVADRDTPVGRDTPSDRDAPVDRDTVADTDTGDLIESFELAPPRIRRGEKVTLTWSAAHAQRVELRVRNPKDPGAGSRSLGDIPVTGSRDVTPEANTDYILVAKNAAGNQVSAVVSVDVRAPLPVIVDLSVSERQITAGEVTSLSWEVRDATRVELTEPGVGSRIVNAKETQEIRPKKTGSYVLVAYNEDKAFDRRGITVTVKAAAPRIASFTSDLQKANAGQAVTLSWKTENATEVELVPVGRVDVSGTHKVTPSQTTLYILVARNGSREVKEDVTIEVTRIRPVLDRTTILRPVQDLRAVINSCKDGYVWREAYTGDHVCVTPEVRAQTAEDNRQADARRQPGGGTYGPNTCRQGFVWREARQGDDVCVTPESRSQAAADNAQAAARRVRN